MSASNKGLFRPGRGSVVALYTAAVASEAMYPSDCVTINTLVPTSQGVSGVFEGKTLGTYDYIECVLSLTTVAGSEGSVLGIVMGKGINSVANWADVSGDVLADGDVINIQSRGVHPAVHQVTGGSLGDWLAISSVAGELVNGTTAALQDVGVALAATAAYTRAVAEDAGPAWIRGA